MKRLKHNQVGPWCTFCPPKLIRATHRESGFARQYCCESHTEDLKNAEAKEHLRESRMTEADRQTWEAL